MKIPNKALSSAKERMLVSWIFTALSLILLIILMWRTHGRVRLLNHAEVKMGDREG